MTLEMKYKILNYYEYQMQVQLQGHKLIFVEALLKAKTNIYIVTCVGNMYIQLVNLQ